MADDGIVFEDLPKDGRRTAPIHWQSRLRERSGEWARLPMSASGVTYLNGSYRGEFEFVGRTVDGKRVLYGRYIGTGA